MQRLFTSNKRIEKDIWNLYNSYIYTLLKKQINKQTNKSNKKIKTKQNKKQKTCPNSAAKSSHQVDLGYVENVLLFLVDFDPLISIAECRKWIFGERFDIWVEKLFMFF